MVLPEPESYLRRDIGVAIMACAFVGGNRRQCLAVLPTAPVLGRTQAAVNLLKGHRWLRSQRVNRMDSRLKNQAA